MATPGLLRTACRLHVWLRWLLPGLWVRHGLWLHRGFYGPPADYMFGYDGYYPGYGYGMDYGYTGASTDRLPTTCLATMVTTRVMGTAWIMATPGLLRTACRLHVWLRWLLPGLWVRHGLWLHRQLCDAPWHAPRPGKGRRKAFLNPNAPAASPLPPHCAHSRGAFAEALVR